MAKLIATFPEASYWLGSGRFPIVRPNLVISELPQRGIIRVQARGSDVGFERILSDTLHLKLPRASEFSRQGELLLAWAGPNEWLLFCQCEQEDVILSALKTKMAGIFAVFTLMTDSRVAYQIRGGEAPEFLAKGCSVDVHPDVFPEGVLAITRFAGLASMIVHASNDHYFLYVDRSYQRFILEWMLDASMEWQSDAV